jgi:hypothetical protein
LDYLTTHTSLSPIQRGLVSMVEEDKVYILFVLIFGVLSPLSAIFKLYHGDQF